jgi:large subunit ribosomal protein L28
MDWSTIFTTFKYTIILAQPQGFSHENGMCGLVKISLAFVEDYLYFYSLLDRYYLRNKIYGAIMSFRCEICGKGPIVGHSKSHADNLTKRRWMPNLQTVRHWDGTQMRRIRVCTSCIQAGKVVKPPARVRPEKASAETE